MKVLELFAGTGSVGKVCKELGFEVVSLDKDMEADIRTDILDWDYRQFPPKQFDFIWASPPCTEYSAAKTVGVRKIDYANEVVLRTIEIIRYFDPTYYLIENPQTGRLKDQPFMRDLPYHDVDCCKYGMSYRKRTKLWGNLDFWIARPLCARDCGNMDERGRAHRDRAQRGPHGPKETWASQRLHSQRELYRVPAELIREILFSIVAQ